MDSSLAHKLLELERKILLLKEQLDSRNRQLFSMQEENASLKNQLAQKTTQIERLEETNKIVKLAEGIHHSKLDLRAVKLEINKQIREIDECIRLLNQ